MNIWGKIIGSTSGFALGGPIGALIGGAAGHAIDKMQTKKKRSDKLALKQIGFTIGIIVLSAKMAKADGKVTKQEILAFKNKIADNKPIKIKINPGNKYDLKLIEKSS